MLICVLEIIFIQLPLGCHVSFSATLIPFFFTKRFSPIFNSNIVVVLVVVFAYLLVLILT